MKHTLGLSPSSGATILIIEDDVTVRDMMCFALEHYGYVVLAAGTGIEGLRLLVSNPPDLVILDLALPDIRGTVLLEIARSRTVGRVIPFIVVSTLTEDGLREDIIALGADYFLHKPFGVGELLVVVEQRLSMVTMMAMALNRSERVPQPDNDDGFLLDLNQWMEKHHAEPDVTADDAARDLAMSRSLFFKRLRTLLNVTFNQLLTRFRMSQARFLIKTEPDASLEQISWRVGYVNQSHFSAVFKKHHGVSPRTFAAAMRSHLDANPPALDDVGRMLFGEAGPIESDSFPP